MYTANDPRPYCFMPSVVSFVSLYFYLSNDGDSDMSLELSDDDYSDDSVENWHPGKPGHRKVIGRKVQRKSFNWSRHTDEDYSTLICFYFGYNVLLCVVVVTFPISNVDGCHLLVK